MVGGVPRMVVRTEGETLFVVGGVGEERPSLAGVLLDLGPQNLANPG